MASIADPQIWQVTTIAGRQGNANFQDGPSQDAMFYTPLGIAVSPDGDIYVCGHKYHKIRKLSDNIVSTFAGSTAGRQDGEGTAAKFNQPYYLAFDSLGDLYVADYKNHQIRKINKEGVVSTYAGTGASGSADGSNAQFSLPRGIAFDNFDNCYVTESTRIRKITPDGVVTTVAGNGSAGMVDGNGTDARFNDLQDITVDAEGILYVSDYNNHKIRKITPGGDVTTVAGNGGGGYLDHVNGIQAQVSHPRGITCDADGNIFFTDNTHCVRKLSPQGAVTTVCGTTNNANFRDGAARQTYFNIPFGIAISPTGDLIIADYNNQIIRKVAASLNPLTSNIPPKLPSTHIIDFTHMLENEATYHDVTFKIGDEITTAHRCILASRCEYFNKMFSSGFREGNNNQRAVCKIEDTTMPALKFVLQYLYTDNMDVHDNIAIDVMRLSHRYGIERLYNHTARHCITKISLSNVVHWFIESDKYELEQLRECTKRYLARNFRKVRKTHKQTLTPLAQYNTLMMEIMMEAL